MMRLSPRVATIASLALGAGTIITIGVLASQQGTRNTGSSHLYVQQGRSGDCTQSNPCDEITTALNRASTGTTIHVSSGNYRAFTVEKSGITIKGEGSQKPRVNAASTDTVGSVHIRSSNVTIDNIGVFNAKRAGIKIISETQRGISGITILNCELGDNGDHGILSAYAYGITVENNRIYGSREQHGVYIAEMPDNFRGRSNITIRENEIYNNASQGIHINSENSTAGPTTGILIEKNTIYNNGHTGWKIPNNNRGEGPGIRLTGAHDVKVINNFLYNNWKGIVLATDVETDAEPTNIQIYHNTIVMPRPQNIRGQLTRAKGAMIVRAAGANVTIRNNIFYNPEPGPGYENPQGDPVQYLAPVDRDYNIYYSRLPATEGSHSYTVKSIDQFLTAFQQPADTEVKVTDTNYMSLSPLNHAFQHCRNSVAFDKGDSGISRTVPRDYYNNPRRDGKPDIGSFECSK